MVTISVEDEEETIEEEEANEGLVDHQAELSDLAREGRPVRPPERLQEPWARTRERVTMCGVGVPHTPSPVPAVTVPMSHVSPFGGLYPAPTHVPGHTASLACVGATHSSQAWSHVVTWTCWFSLLCSVPRVTWFRGSLARSGGLGWKACAQGLADVMGLMTFGWLSH